jgi:arsenite methyltransferase
MSQKILINERADYGLDAPTLVQKLLLGGGALAIVGLGFLIWGNFLQGLAGNIVASVSIAIFITGIIVLLTGIMMIWSSRFGKMHARDRLLDGLQLRGNETVLDLGCGRGLVLQKECHRDVL